MTKFEKYQLLYYQKEIEKQKQMIEELVFENRVLSRANVKLGVENSKLRDEVLSRDFNGNGIVCMARW
ncbi:hypothetical protein JHL18_06210 [Clostridium sp. YIM B02505]|uniref:Uncharacterized protein n=1 Tax=Clostridium yunnanense TaxID=2800325 RepID=A0ABS1ELJ8_9CLOT|nr:hypothetical protein [Clostridium yunnanense]MBK1810229.1 hypothetical protein [Clostridium yunnanense]